MNQRRKSGSTALHVACLAGKISIVKKLLESNAELDVVRENGQSPLLLACYQNDFPLVKLLLNYEPKIHTEMSPIHICSQFGNIAIFKELILNGADINFKNGNGDFPLLVACQYSSYNIVSYLMDNFYSDEYNNTNNTNINYNNEEKENNNNNNSNPNLSDEFKSTKEKRMELDVKVCREEDGRNALLVACTQHNLSIVKKLIFKANFNCNSSENGELPLLLAIIHNHYSIFEFLIESFVFCFN